MATSTINYTRNTINIWFPDQREPVYDVNDPEALKTFHAYWKKEKQRINKGFYLADGKVYISGWLYWHTVYWKIKMQIKVNGRTFPDFRAPYFRDIDWEASLNFERAINEGKFIELAGSRGFGKTVWQGSYAARIYTMVNNSQVVISGGNSDDVKRVTDMVSDGLTYLHPIFQKKRLRNDWKKEILAGYKNPDGSTNDKSSLSQIVIVNYQDGNDTMAANGLRPNFHVIDEIGKISNFLKCVKDSDGCWWANQELPDDGSPIRPTCLPFFTGTGGDMEVGADAADMFFNPTANNILEFPDLWEGKKEIGWFMPVTKARNEYKEDKTLSEYLGISHPDLDRVIIKVSNEEKCMKEWWTPRYEKEKKSGSSVGLLSFLAYWPIKPSDSFKRLTSNNFNTEAAQAQQLRIKQNYITGTPVELYHDGETIKHKFSDKLPIMEFPLKTESKDAPIVIWEFPIASPPFGLYVAGIDPYRTGKAEYSDSLGAIYIFKRMHDISSEKYQNMLVASYVARPDQHETWQEQARMLIKFYNARALCENNELSFINYMINKGDAQYLEAQPAWLKDIVPNTKQNQDYGINRSSSRVIDYLHGCVKRYLDEVLKKTVDENGSVISEVLGVQRIHDYALLEEIVKFDEKNGNFDREIAFSLALALAEHLDPKIGRVSDNQVDSRITQLYKKDKPKSGMFSAPFSKQIASKPRKSKLFR